jgi:hypothetical protein
MRTTPPASVDFAGLLPDLAPLRKTTVRLHPRRNEGLTPSASKMGGPIAWPADEPWPACASTACGCSGPLVPVLQLRREDIPSLPFPEGRTIFQLLWCPRDPEGLGPYCRAFWRSSPGIPRDTPERTDTAGDLVPRACALDPEQVLELPSMFELPVSQAARIHAIEEAEHDGHPVYHYLASVAPGTKVGGHISWIQDPSVPACTQGHRMVHLLTVASAEFDGGSWPRWCPTEDAHVWGAPFATRWPVQFAAGVMLGDMGNLYVFTCLACADRPIASLLQCS